MTAAPARRPVHDIKDIVAGLAAQAEALCRDLLPRGHREHEEWMCGSGESPFGCSTAVHLRGPKAGVWGAWSAAQHGDALDLVAALECDGDKKRAVPWALAWLGLDGREPERRQRTERALATRQDEPPAVDTKAAAFRIWLSAQPSLKGTPAEAYLAARGIELARLGRQPRALRFHPRLADGPRDNPNTRYWPALVAAIVKGGEHVAVHRTWLMVKPNGDVQKAPIVDSNGDPASKRTYGTYAGGLIPLWRGASGRPLKEAARGETMILSEGIEDGLSCAIAAPEFRVAAAVSLSNMGSVELPPAIATVLIAAQNDPWWHEQQQRQHGAQRGLDRAIRHFQKQGRSVRLIRPSAGKDVNDLLRGIA